MSIDTSLGTTSTGEDGATDRTHIFLLRWLDREAEIRFKNPSEKSYVGNRAATRRDEWTKGFEDLQEKWVRGGMSVRSCHLRFRRWF